MDRSGDLVRMMRSIALAATAALLASPHRAQASYAERTLTGGLPGTRRQAPSALPDPGGLPHHRRRPVRHRHERRPAPLRAERRARASTVAPRAGPARPPPRRARRPHRRRDKYEAPRAEGGHPSRQGRDVLRRPHRRRAGVGPAAGQGRDRRRERDHRQAVPLRRRSRLRWRTRATTAPAPCRYALHGGDLLDSPLDSSGLARWGVTGAGRVDHRLRELRARLRR